MAGRVIYSRELKEKVTQEDPGKVMTSSAGQNGTFPLCLPQEWREGFPKGFMENAAEVQCSCGKHTLYAVRKPKEVWPENSLVAIRVIED